jgi:cytochrome c
MKSRESNATFDTAAWVMICLALASSISACGGPEPEIRARLSEREREIFDRGKRLSTPCWACHDLYGEQNKVGPYLSGLYGRTAGSARFAGYSQAMKNSNVIWNDASLRAFLLNVSGYIPGTSMNATGPAGRVDVDALVFYLGQVTASTSDP